MTRDCLDCRVAPALPGTSRCAVCTRTQQRRRNAQPKRKAYQDPLYQAMLLVGSCALCGSTDDLTRDHIVPLAHGGTNERSNLRILCRSCNSSKGAA